MHKRNRASGSMQHPLGEQGFPGHPAPQQVSQKEGLHHLQQGAYVPRRQVMLPGDKINEDQLICK